MEAIKELINLKNNSYNNTLKDLSLHIDKIEMD